MNTTAINAEQLPLNREFLTFDEHIRGQQISGLHADVDLLIYMNMYTCTCKAEFEISKTVQPHHGEHSKLLLYDALGIL